MDLNQVYDTTGVTSKGAKDTMGYIFIALAFVGAYSLIIKFKSKKAAK
jgi:hypothetical protein